MAIDGKREGAERKSQWRSPTKMIRLPEKYEAQIIAYAKLLDSESESVRIDFETRFHGELMRRLDTVLMRIRPSDRRAANQLFKKLLPAKL